MSRVAHQHAKFAPCANELNRACIVTRPGCNGEKRILARHRAIVSSRVLVIPHALDNPMRFTMRTLAKANELKTKVNQHCTG
jgi:hypothetical protein